MNKVVTVSISGMVFTIEENGYSTLKTYLDRLKAHFAATEGREEILSDIESRIAEMLHERLNGRTVVEQADIDTVIAVMGKAEDMAEGETSQPGAGASAGATGSGYHSRRIFRDPDDKVLGGVCSGIASYFGFDPIFLRLIFVIAFFGFGSGFLVYIVLMIIIPKAKTASEKLQMKGERVNISNIEKTVKENLGTWGDEVRDFSRDGGTRIGHFFSSLGEALGPIFHVLVRIVAVVVVAVSLVVVIALAVSALGMAGVVPAVYPDFINDVFDSRSEMAWASLSAALVIGIPFLALLYYAMRALLNVRSPQNHIVSAVFLAAWVVGIVMALGMGMKASGRFRYSENLEQRDTLAVAPHDTLYLAATDVTAHHPNHTYHWHSQRHGMVEIHTDPEDEMYSATLDIRPSDTKDFFLVKEITARGASRPEAYRNAQQIEYDHRLEGNTLYLDNHFTPRKGARWRAQEMQLILEVPVGKVIVMKRGMENIIYDIENEQDMWDGDMIGRHWLMTANGLTCLDCPAEEPDQERRHRSAMVVL